MIRGRLVEGQPVGLRLILRVRQAGPDGLNGDLVGEGRCTAQGLGFCDALNQAALERLQRQLGPPPTRTRRLGRWLLGR